MKTIIAIDPGKSGGIAFRCGKSCGTQPMPETFGELTESLREFKQQATIEGCELVAYVERVQGFAGKNRPGFHMFGLGENFGAIQGILAALNVRTILVRPQEWQKGFQLGSRSTSKSDNDWKNKLKAEAQRRFPELKVTLKTADALLILEYAQKQAPVVFAEHEVKGTNE